MELARASEKLMCPPFPPLLLIGSFLNLQIIRKCIILWICFNFGEFGPQTKELVALEHLKIPPYTYNWENGVPVVFLLEKYSKYFNDFTFWLSGEQLLPFGLLV